MRDLTGDFCDAWLEVHGADSPGFTYDGKDNAMLGNRLRSRPDRCLVHGRLAVKSARRVGMEPIPGLTYRKQRTVKKVPTEVLLPVLPSDHFGLFVTFGPR